MLPWIHLSTHPSGHCSLCCIADHTDMKYFARDGENKLLNLSKNSPQEIMESASYQKTREMMLKGEYPPACRPCYDMEERGITSTRMKENKTSYTGETFGDGSYGNPENVDLRYLELRLGNVCNVRCRSCNPSSSSQWKKDYQKLIQITPSMGDTHPDSLCEFKWPERPGFWEELKQYPNIEEIYINGGEPTLIKQHWKFLEDLIESGRAKDIKLWYSVNMTRMPDEIEMWKEFKAVRIEASIDDLEHRNHYIRYPTKWEDVLVSIERLNDHDVDWGIMQTITPMNVYYLAEFKQWARKQEAWVSYNFVKDPNYLDVRFIPQELKWEIMRMMPNVVLDPSDFTSVVMTLDRYWETKNKTLPNYWDKFCEFNRNLDILRGESFQEIFPEFCETLTRLDLEIP